ncbi:GGDEF domain-containing protein [Cognatilysobacter tabacisoli]|uniref:GGDEF domain-containing protein n=1 Tax=Cognatilysobacter tabacisoli TaxID=2315424 RepID=UPI000E6AF85A|nr:sensor domain-containing diguanylate cyclase [Lysobacter tabacisoli]
MPTGAPAADAVAAEPRRRAALEAYAILDTAPEAAFDDIVRLACMLCDVDAAAIAFADIDRFWFKARRGIDVDGIPREPALSEAVLAAPGTLEVPDRLAVPSLAGLSLPLEDGPACFIAAAPLRDPHGSVLGALFVSSPRPRRLSATQREGLELLARQTTHLLELRRYDAEQQRQLRERELRALAAERARAELQRHNEQLLLSVGRDELTGLLNRSALNRLSDDAQAHPDASPSHYSLVLLDIDHFKQINDRHGHLLGDRALRVVGDAITASVRAGDVPVRYGGEEFLVVLPGGTLASAAEVAHRIRAAVAEASLPFPLTLSAGIAAGDARDRREAVFERADQALYRAKAMGRDRIVVDDTPRLHD